MRRTSHWCSVEVEPCEVQVDCTVSCCCCLLFTVRIQQHTPHESAAILVRVPISPLDMTRQRQEAERPALLDLGLPALASSYLRRLRRLVPPSDCDASQSHLLSTTTTTTTRKTVHHRPHDSPHSNDDHEIFSRRRRRPCCARIRPGHVAKRYRGHVEHQVQQDSHWTRKKCAMHCYRDSLTDKPCRVSSTL